MTANNETRRELWKILISFIILFFFYHAAEYMILFKNNTAGFFIFQLLFFMAAWLLGNWTRRSGLACWGLPFTRRIPKYILIGLPLGILLYAVPFLVSLGNGTEQVTYVPAVTAIFTGSLPFAFGVIFSSFSEDILTRGIVFRLLNNRIKNIPVIIISAAVYLLNHIYRLNDGSDKLLYIFLLGILLIIPVFFSQNLWITGTMHWAGNTFFYITHNVILTQTMDDKLSPDFLFAIWIAVYIPLVIYIFRIFKTRKVLPDFKPMNPSTNNSQNDIL